MVGDGFGVLVYACIVSSPGMMSVSSDWSGSKWRVAGMAAGISVIGAGVLARLVCRDMAGVPLCFLVNWFHERRVLRFDGRWVLSNLISNLSFLHSPKTAKRSSPLVQ